MLMEDVFLITSVSKDKTTTQVSITTYTGKQLWSWGMLVQQNATHQWERTNSNNMDESQDMLSETEDSTLHHNT